MLASSWQCTAGDLHFFGWWIKFPVDGRTCSDSEDGGRISTRLGHSALNNHPKQCVVYSSESDVSMSGVTALYPIQPDTIDCYLSTMLLNLTGS